LPNAKYKKVTSVTYQFFAAVTAQGDPSTFLEFS